LTNCRVYVVVTLAVFVFAFASFHPYFDAAGFCGLGGCPDASHSSHGSHGAGFSTACMAAVLIASLATSAFGSFSGRRRAANQRRPAAAYLSPDTPPPRVLPSH